MCVCVLLQVLRSWNMISGRRPVWVAWNRNEFEGICQKTHCTMRQMYHSVKLSKQQSLYAFSLQSWGEQSYAVHVTKSLTTTALIGRHSSLWAWFLCSSFLCGTGPAWIRFVIITMLQSKCEHFKRRVEVWTSVSHHLLNALPRLVMSQLHSLLLSYLL